jgi:uncharacterized peroxidase-related enzyme
MEKFKLHTLESAPDGSKAILSDVAGQMKFIPNLYAVMAESPQVIKAYSEMGKLFGQTSFSLVEKNLIWLAISHTNSCHYCTAIHSMVAKMYNVSESIIEALRTNKPISDPKLQALRQFTVSMVEKRGWASEQEINDFLSAGYTKAQILELIVGIAQKTISNYVNHVAGTPLDEPVKPFAWHKEEQKIPDILN